MRARRVRFKDEGSWWRGDSNAMLAFRAEDGRPVALLPGMFGRYREIDPVSKRSLRMTADRAGRAGGGSLDVLPAIAVGGRETEGPAENRPARIGRGFGAAGHLPGFRAA